MMTIIVPTDFSTDGDNAARYAAKMIKGQKDVRIILFHIYDKASEAAEANRMLDILRSQLIDTDNLDIECIAEEGGDVVNSLERIARHLDAQLVVMGFNSKSMLGQVFGSNTLKMIEKNICPVLVVPISATYKQVKNVSLLSDFKNVATSIPSVPIKNVLQLFKPAVHVINVNSEHYVSLTEKFLSERNMITDMFKEYNPEFYFIGTYDLHETVKQFVADKQIDMLITIPREHSFFEGIFKTSNTKKLINETEIPILAAHE